MPEVFKRAWKRNTLGRLISDKPSSSSCEGGELEDSSLESPVFGNFSFENMLLCEESTPSPLVVPEMTTLKALLNLTRTSRPSCIKLAETEANYELKPGTYRCSQSF